MREQHPLKDVIEKLPQRSVHQFGILTIFVGEEGKAVWLEMNQSVAEGHAAAISVIVNCDLTKRSSIDRDSGESLSYDLAIVKPVCFRKIWASAK